MDFLRFRRHKYTYMLIHLLRAKGFVHTTIIEISENEDMVKLVLELPIHKELSEFESIIPNIVQEFKGLDHRIKYNGKRIFLDIGKRNLNGINYDNSHLSESLKLKIPTSFGDTYIDFSDGASCHLLNGGTTRMGKTYFLLYLTTLMYLQNRGHIDLYITSAKIKDYYPFIGVPNVHLSKTHDDMIQVLDTLIKEYRMRDGLLNTPSLLKATDAKDVLKYNHT